MDAERLRRAAERAGLDVRRFAVAYSGWYVVIQFNGKETIFPSNHPLLPAYVASILVGMVRELGRKIAIDYGWKLLEAGAKTTWVATPAQQITAAMAVLEKADG